MLQIATGMYFPDGAELSETTHRHVFYTNAGSISSAPADLPFGRFLLSTGLEHVNALTVEVVDRLEEVDSDGNPSSHAATDGADHIDDAADLFAFVFNVTCTRSLGLAESLIPQELKRGLTRNASGILRRTCDPGILLDEGEFVDAHTFANKLLSLERQDYEAAIRAIRTVVDASMLVYDEPGLAYTLYVAALESLAQKAIPAASMLDWDRYPGERRKLFETAFTASSVSDEQADVIRDAAMRADQLSLKRRFTDFTLDHIDRPFYREEAVEARSPTRAVDLEHALSIAYDLRSRNVHSLEHLSPELWAIADRNDTLLLEGRRVLGLEGLNRLSRHVVKNFVARAPTGLDARFDYRQQLPGTVRVKLDPRFWIANAEVFTAKRAPVVLDGLCRTLLDLAAELPNMSAVLKRIEQLLGGTTKLSDRAPMVAIYRIWHHVTPPEYHRPNAEDTIREYRSDLDSPSFAGLAARMLTTTKIEWHADDLVALTEERRKDMMGGRKLLPARVDASFLVHTAVVTWNDHPERARTLLAQAVELLPGDEALIEIEHAATDGVFPVKESVLDVLRPPTTQTGDGPANSGEDSAADVVPASWPL